MQQFIQLPAVKNDGIMKFAQKWVELETIILNEATQTQKDKHVMYSFISRYCIFSKR